MKNDPDSWLKIHEKITFPTPNDLPIEEIQKQLIDNPNSIELQAKNVSHYLQTCDTENPDLINGCLWFIENYPDVPWIHYSLFVPVSPEHENGAYFLAEPIWLAHLDRDPQNIQLIKNALPYIELHPAKIAELQKRLLQLSDNNLQSQLEYFAYSVRQLEYLHPSQRKLNALNLIKDYKRIEPDLRKDSDILVDGILMSITLAAECAFHAEAYDDLEKYCQEILNIPKWPFFENSTANAHQDALTLQGLAALKQGHTQSAIEYLQKSSQLQFSPNTIPWMYPNRDLVSALYKANEIDAVVDFLSSYPSAVTGTHETFLETIPLLQSSQSIIFSNLHRPALRIACNGIRLAKNNKLDRAKEYLTNARNLLTHDAATLFHLAELEAAVSEITTAIAHLRLAIELKPTCIENAKTSPFLQGIVEEIASK